MPENSAASGQIPPDDALRRVLNRHGYGFQYAALKRCINQGTWKSAVAEYPVDLNGESVHIDFVLGFKAHLLVVECKRIEGFRWGFARGHSDARDSAAYRPRADFLRWGTPAGRPRETVLLRETRGFGPSGFRPYDVHVELKRRGADEKDSDDNGKTPRSLENAVTQVFRARGGLIEDLARQGAMRYEGGAIIPAIFTTATLVSTDDELREAELSSGRMATMTTSERPYLWFDHNLSRALRPDIPMVDRGATEVPTKTEALRTSLQRDITRSVGVVSASGIERFLNNLSEFLSFERTEPI